MGLAKIAVGIYILNIGKFDLAAGSYTVDFYLTLTSDKPLPPELELEFINGRAQHELVQTQGDGKERQYRVLAALSTNIDLRGYPLDRQTLPIILEHKSRADILLEPDLKRTALDPDVTFVGWALGDLKTRVVQHEYKAFDETYSRYTLDVTIERLRLPAILKSFMPVLCFIVIVFLSAFITLEKMENRLSLGIGVLIASVMFHVSQSSNIPPVAYLTLTDKAMMATYFVNGVNLLVTVLLMRRMQRGDRAAAEVLAKRGYYAMPAITLVSFLLVAMV